MKKKITALCLIVALALTAIGGATLAYFTDKDAQTNVFTAGNVAIDLFEDFDNDGNGFEKLVPATYVDGVRQNNVEKEIYVKNTGSEEAYVRIHFAIPAALDQGYPDFNASENILHWNFWNYGNKLWNWTNDADPSGYDSAKWNFYETTMMEGEKEVKYNVYVATFETPLAADATTPNAVWNVYMDKATTNEVISEIKAEIGDTWYIHVAAEAAQVEGFDDAYTALNTAFGVPGSEGYTVNWTAAKGDTFVNLD